MSSTLIRTFHVDGPQPSSQPHFEQDEQTPIGQARDHRPNLTLRRVVADQDRRELVDEGEEPLEARPLPFSASLGLGPQHLLEQPTPLRINHKSQDFLVRSQRNTIAMDAFNPRFNALLNPSGSPAELCKPVNHEQLSNEATHTSQFASNRESAAHNHEDSTVTPIVQPQQLSQCSLKEAGETRFKQLQDRTTRHLEEQKVESMCRDSGIYPGHRGLLPDDLALIEEAHTSSRGNLQWFLQRGEVAREARLGVNGVARERRKRGVDSGVNGVAGGGEGKREKVVVGKLRASEMYEDMGPAGLYRQCHGQPVVRAPGAGTSHDAAWELWQTRHALDLDRARAAPFQPARQYQPQPQSQYQTSPRNQQQQVNGNASGDVQVKVNGNSNTNVHVHANGHPPRSFLAAPSPAALAREAAREAGPRPNGDFHHQSSDESRLYYAAPEQRHNQQQPDDYQNQVPALRKLVDIGDYQQPVGQPQGLVQAKLPSLDAGPGPRQGRFLGHARAELPCLDAGPGPGPGPNNHARNQVPTIGELPHFELPQQGGIQQPHVHQGQASVASEPRLGHRQQRDSPTAAMDKLQVRSSEISNVKAKAQEDAKKMQAHVLEECKKAGKDPPSYALVELIGKGSFGRVYMGKDMKSAAIVAVKIIDIDESDTLNPRTADSYSEFLKEVNALKILSENKAKNINHVIEALPVNQAMWMITEYCGGGSVATLMKPSAPRGLLEKWIIPILREVAEALKWVHQADIIHRDIKCANVLITEQGGVQLCDFGVAGIMENKGNKRSTMVGTPHWMAPEMFGENPSYSQEVDIWAFGAMTYEIATGLPPNVANGIPYERLGYHLKNNMPRLEGGSYSNELRSLVAYLLEEDPKARPSIEQVQKHKYIANTGSTYPTTNLRSLVGSFRVWESHGGSRKSLFMQHGAQAPSYAPSGQDEWNFSTTEVFDQKVVEEFSTQDLIDAYGPSISFDEATEATARPRQNGKSSRRRPPPEALARMPAPLEKLFDPNTITNYEDNSRMHYGKGMPSAPSTSDLPLRDDSAQTSIKDTMIDLGGHDTETGISSFSDMDTIKAGRHQDDPDDVYNSSLHDFSRPALSDPADINMNRRTQDWKFPDMPPASADPELSRFPSDSYELPRPAVTPGSGGRPTLVHHPTEPIGAFGGGLGPIQSGLGRLSMAESLIDLDMSLPSSIPEIRRPSTANSDVSASSEQMAPGNPFELERHASLYEPTTDTSLKEGPSGATRLRTGNPLQDLVDMSDFSASDVEGPQANDRTRRAVQYDAVDGADYQGMPPPPLPDKDQANPPPSGPPYTMAHFPPLRPPPSIAIMTGTASVTELAEELVQGIGGLHDQLSAFRDVYSSLESTPRRTSATARRENSQD